MFLLEVFALLGLCQLPQDVLHGLLLVLLPLDVVLYQDLVVEAGRKAGGRRRLALVHMGSHFESRELSNLEQSQLLTFSSPSIHF